MRDVVATMPAIAFLEDLKVAQRRFRSMFLAVTPDDLRFTTHGYRETSGKLKGEGR